MVFQILAKIEMTRNKNQLFGRHFEMVQHLKFNARVVTSATHVFELFKDENSWVAEVSSDCVNYISGHIDTKYLDQASWIYDRTATSQRLK